MMSRQRRRLLLIVSVSLLLVMFTSVQFQAQNLLPPPPAPGENTVIVPLLPQSDPMQFTGVRDTELLQNGGFEVAGANAKQAANWTGVNLLSTSRRLCDRIGHPTKPDRIVAHEGSCGFRFNAQITNVTRQIKQIVPVMGTVNDTLEMSYWATGNNISTPPRAQVVVTYTDKTKQKLKIPALTGTFGYTQFSGSMSLEKTPKKIVVKFIVAGSGRLYIDEASLRHEFYQYAPVANDDALVAVIGTAAVAGNVTGNDMLANPPAAVASFGGGSLGGAVGDNMAGATVAIPGSGGVTVSVAADGTVNVDAASGTPIPGTYTFDYLLQNVAGSDAATVTLNVNSAPVANPDTFKMLANTVLSGNLNSDNGGGADVMGVPTATITSFGGGSLGGDVTSNAAGSAVSLAGGTLTVNPNGAITLSNPLQGGLFTFSYRLSNTAGFSDGLVTIEINKAPTAVDDGPYNVNVNTSLNVTTAGNDLLDNDDRGYPLASIVSFGLSTATESAPGASVSVAGGTLVVNADGSFSLTTPTITGTYTFHYAIENIIGSDTATVTFNVRRPPLAEDDAFNMLVNGTLNGDLKANNGSGIDIPGTPPFNALYFGGGDVGGSVTSHLAPASVPLAGGTLTINADGTFSLVNPTQTGVFTFTYRLTNAIPAFDTATVTIEIRSAPVAVDDGPYLIGTGQTLTVTTAAANDLLDNDTRGYPLASVISFGGGNATLGGVTDLPAGGTANNFGGGNLTVNANGSFTLVNPTMPGTYTFLYRISNIVGSSDAIVTIQVQQSPVAQNDAFNMLLNGTLGGDLTANNGSGVDSLGTPPFNSLQFGGGDLGGGVTSYLAPATVPLAGGALTVNADGTFTLLNPLQTGVFSFTYRITNAIPASDDAVVTIEVRKAPSAVDDGIYLVGTGQTLTVTTASNHLLDNDDRGYPLAQVSTFGGGSVGGTISTNLSGASVGLAGGTLTVNANGSFTLATPNVPGTYTFLYRIANAAGMSDATVTIQVQQSPVAQDDSFIVQLNGTLNGNLTADNGSGVDSPGVPPYNSLTFGGGSLTGDASSNAAGATVELAGGDLTVNLDGTFSLVNPTQAGVYTFQYRLSNTIPASDDATVTIDVRATPVARDDALIATYGVTNNFPAGTLFADNGSGVDFLGVPAGSIDSFGTVSATQMLTEEPQFVSFAGGTLRVNADGSIIVANPTQTGEFIFYYRLQNASGFDDAQVTVTVQRPPTANDDAFTVQINTTLNGDLNDDNGSGADILGYPVATVASFGGGSLTGDASSNAAGATVELAGGDLTVNPDGTILLVNPTLTGVYTFQYRLSNTIPASDDATVTIDVRAAPIAQDDAWIAAYGMVNSEGSLFADNGNGADFLGVPAATVVSFGTTSSTDNVSGTPVPFAGGTLHVQSNGAFTIIEPIQTGEFTFYYRLQNVSGFDDAQVTVTVRQAPVARDDAFTMMVNTTLSGQNLLSDNGSGADVLGYPVAGISSFGGGSIGTPITTSQPGWTVAFAGGNLTIHANGNFTLLNPTQTGVYTVQYRLTNVVGFSDATVTFNIQQTPVAADDLTYTVVSGQTLDLLEGNGLLVNDALGFPQAAVTSYGGSDAGGTVATYMANTSVSPVPGYVNGMLQINAAGTGVFTPPTLPTRFCGEFDFSYRLGNSAGSDDAAVKITVLCGPDAKNDLFNSGFVTEAGGVGLTGSLFTDHGGGADDLGYEAAVLTGFSAVGGGATSNAPGASIALADGTLTVNADGSFTVASVTTPGTYTFDYTIANTSGSDTATVTIMIDEAPRVLAITPEDGAVNVLPSTNIVINFSEVVNIAVGGITLECPADTDIAFAPTLPLSSVSTVTVNPTSDLPGNTLCIVTVVSSQVTDVDAIDAPNYLDGNNDGVEGPDFVSSFTTAPVAVDDAYTVTPHLTYDSSAVTPQAFSVRNNDDPADSTAIIGFGATAATTTVVPDGTNFITAEGAGGRVVLNADGTFLFYPDAGYTAISGPATFYYTITGGSTAKVTLTFEAEELVWFVDATPSDTVCTGTNVGTQACPVSAPGNGVSTAHTASDTIFIAEGAYNCQITLKNNVKVIGDGATGTTLEEFSGVSPVSGSSFAPYATFTGVDPTLTSTASCFTLGTGNTIRGLTVGNTTYYALFSMTAVGTLTVTDVSINGTGGWFALTGGGTLNGTFNELLSSAYTNPVIDLTNVGGTITHTSGTITHAHADTPTLRINGGNPIFTYSGSITKTAGGRVIDIRNTTANTITFSGTVTQNVVAGSGILIDGQTGGTVTFTTINLGSAGTRLNNGAITVTNGSSSSTVNLGTINLYTSGGTGHALTSTGHDGALNITGGNINADNGGRAIDIDGPTDKTALNISLSNVSAAGAGDFGVKLVDIDGTVGITTLLSVANKTDGLLVGGSSAAITIKKLNVSNTTADAVRLYNNGGSFTIIGDGTLANVDGEGGSFTNIGENAFDFLNVQNITLNDITVTGTGSHAFTGVGVNTLTIDNVDVSNVGTGDNQHVFNFKDGGTTNLVGTVSITDSLFTNFAENGMYIENFSGTLNLTVTNVEFENNISKLVCSGGNCDGMGILLRADGTATMTVTISSVTFDRIDGIAVSANPEGYSGAFMDIDILNNSFAANTYVSPGNTNNGETAISLRNAQGNGTLKFNVDNNTINNYSGEFALGVIEVEAGDFTNTSGFINNNRINGAPMGEAIMLFADGSNTSDPGSTTSFDLVVAVTNNTVNAPVRGANLAVIGNGSITGSDANTQVTVINNQFNAPVTGPVLRGNLTVETMDFNKVCANITGNNVANGALGTKSIDFYYDDNATAFLQGMAGFGNPNAITRLMPPNNTLTDGVYLDGDGSITSATCTMPVP